MLWRNILTRYFFENGEFLKVWILLYWLWQISFTRVKKDLPKGPDNVTNVDCSLLYILTSIWVLHTPNADEILIFNIVNFKRLKKEKKIQICSKISKNVFLKFATRHWSKVFCTHKPSKKTTIKENLFYLGIKHLTRVLVQT